MAAATSASWDMLLFSQTLESTHLVKMCVIFLILLVFSTDSSLVRKNQIENCYLQIEIVTPNAQVNYKASLLFSSLSTHPAFSCIFKITS